ncbi:hypothetical protein Slala03_54640 [Streptomyces lavendulae subsp. lavendulae]|nr:hypothetical protein Slala03_54640 [Streptomyces lavendulae subsp. lavendulae]
MSDMAEVAARFASPTRWRLSSLPSSAARTAVSCCSQVPSFPPTRTSLRPVTERMCPIPFSVYASDNVVPAASAQRHDPDAAALPGDHS